MTSDVTTDAETIRERVREKYAERAQRVAEGAVTEPNTDPITSNLYDLSEQQELPAEAVLASLGCGNPTALAQLHPGEIVLDLGSGGGIDVLLSARRVGPTGFAFGLDITDEMLQLAERNKRESGLKNVGFLKGQIEEIPLPNESVDVIISNCVINLSADKGQVLREAFRVLRPGGRFAVSDVVAQGTLPDDLRRDLEAWVGCVAGALEEQEYRRLLAEAGFTDIAIEATRVYDPSALQLSLSGGSACCGSTGEASCCSTPSEWNPSAYERYAASGGRLISGYIRATKPGGVARQSTPTLPLATAEATTSCCGPNCCAS